MDVNDSIEVIEEMATHRALRKAMKIAQSHIDFKSPDNERSKTAVMIARAIEEQLPCMMRERAAHTNLRPWVNEPGLAID